MGESPTLMRETTFLQGFYKVTVCGMTDVSEPSRGSADGEPTPFERRNGCQVGRGLKVARPCKSPNSRTRDLDYNANLAYTWGVSSRSKSRNSDHDLRRNRPALSKVIALQLEELVLPAVTG